jgi:hypothetical protein
MVRRRHLAPELPDDPHLPRLPESGTLRDAFIDRLAGDGPEQLAIEVDPGSSVDAGPRTRNGDVDRELQAGRPLPPESGMTLG